MTCELLHPGLVIGRGVRPAGRPGQIRGHNTRTCRSLPLVRVELRCVLLFHLWEKKDEKMDSLGKVKCVLIAVSLRPLFPMPPTPHFHRHMFRPLTPLLSYFF